MEALTFHALLVVLFNYFDLDECYLEFLFENGYLDENMDLILLNFR